MEAGSFLFFFVPRFVGFRRFVFCFLSFIFLFGLDGLMILG